MVIKYTGSKLDASGVEFYNFPGAGEAAADAMNISHAVVLPVSGRTIHVGGQVGIKDDDSVPANLEDEVNEAFEHVKAALQEAGLEHDATEHIYKVRALQVLSLQRHDAIITLLQNNSDVSQVTFYSVGTAGLDEAIQAASLKFLGKTRAVWVGVTVASLFRPDLHFEVSVEAYLQS